MTYPLDQLAIIAPIIFIVLIIAFPIIGVFAGWKRGLFWGGGNFLFYVIGLLVWRFAGASIAGLITPLIAPLLEQLGGSGDITKLTISVASPLFFIVWFALAELLLLINYYAWYKRVVGLKAPKVDSKKNSSRKVAKVQTNTKQGAKVKAINMVGGALCLGALTVPTTIAFTDSVFYLTTSRATRASNSLSANLYNGLTSLQSKMSWFSYYTVADSASDFDGLFAGLAFMTQKITYIDHDSHEVHDKTVTEAVTDVFTDIGDVLTKTQEEGITVEKMVDEVNLLADSWNSILDNYGNIVKPLFESENVSVFLSGILSEMFEKQEGLKLDNEAVETIFGDDGIFSTLEEAYAEHKYGDKDIKQLSTIDVSETSFDAIKSVIVSTFDLTEVDDEGMQELFDEKIAYVIGMIVVPPDSYWDQYK